MLGGNFLSADRAPAPTAAFARVVTLAVPVADDAPQSEYRDPWLADRVLGMFVSHSAS